MGDMYSLLKLPYLTQSYDIAAGRVDLDREGALAQVGLGNDTIASQDQHRHRGRPSNLETSEAVLDPVLLQQAPASTVSPIEAGRNVSTQDSHELETLSSDQARTCTTCPDGHFDDYWRYFEKPLGVRSSIINRCLDERTFGCRIPGCSMDNKE